MLSLRRTVRFSLAPLPPPSASVGTPFHPLREPRHNPYSGWPAAQGPTGVGAFTEIEVEVRGRPDPRTGYLVNITVLDGVVREEVVPWLTRRFAEQFQGGAPIEPCQTTREIALRVEEGFRRLVSASLAASVAECSLASVTWRIAPTLHHRYELAMPHRIEVRQQFEFSAAHRLHCPGMDEAGNRAIFGKCNNPNGHGHNYRLEVGAAVPLGIPGETANGTPPPLSVGTLDQIVDETVLRRLDHKHLNLDVPEFADLNPSVEHIAKVCYDLLAPALAAHGAAITSVTVWETEKTSCTYPAPAPA